MTPGQANGRLVVVATPIGNLGDLSPRAAEVLAEADHLCCEDTRRTRALLSAVGIAGGGRLCSLHAHNETGRITQVLGWLAQGHQVALVSDAGTPLVSDPGGQLVAAAIEAGAQVSAVPGPSAVLAALVVSGLGGERFFMEGFLPRRGGERRRRLAALAGQPHPTVVLEAPARVAATLNEMAALAPERRVAVARELTKLHEEVWRGTLAQAAATFSERQVRGEVVIVVEGAPRGPRTVDPESLKGALEQRLASGDSPSRAAARVAADLGVPRRMAYQQAIELGQQTEA